ncbi:FAD-dependent monooxygenase [Streptomyces rectiverticillatus]|uniref:FAD-dependent monooxygenase n=1 Tax=Streptomyces rectiverticillatus TaxID=173860 RepID=UPI0015C3C48A|nr:FAD-dependent monooxygenase [Streptomyces rectiverticillatus]
MPDSLVLPGSVQVAVVGAGPVGLWLAGELALRGVSCAVLEREPHITPVTRALVLHARTLEYLDMRGMAHSFLTAGHRYRHYPLGAVHATAPFTALDSPFPHALALPQHRTTSLLEEHAVKLGAPVFRGVDVTGLREDGDDVVLTACGAGRKQQIRAAYVAGCDGARSTVRRLAGISAPRSVHPYDVLSVDARVDLEPRQPWSTWGRAGMAILLPFGDGRWRVILYDYRSPRPGDRAQATVDADRARELLRAVTGSSLGLRDVEWISRYRCEQQHAVRYRHHRVVLAGDAAHVHPPTGGQGLNTGIADAMGLGWRLAAAAAEPRHDSLLDAYTDERRRAATRVLHLTSALLHFNAAPSSRAHVLRATVLLGARLPTVRRRLAAALAGLPPAAPYTARRIRGGQRAPDVALLTTLPGAPARLFEALRDGRHVHLIPPCGTPDPRAAALEHPLTTAHSAAYRRPCLVRPDGHFL